MFSTQPKITRLEKEKNMIHNDRRKVNPIKKWQLMPVTISTQINENTMGKIFLKRSFLGAHIGVQKYPSSDNVNCILLVHSKITRHETNKHNKEANILISASSWQRYTVNPQEQYHLLQLLMSSGVRVGHKHTKRYWSNF